MSDSVVLCHHLSAPDAGACHCLWILLVVNQSLRCKLLVIENFPKKDKFVSSQKHVEFIPKTEIDSTKTFLVRVDLKWKSKTLNTFVWISHITLPAIETNLERYRYIFIVCATKMGRSTDQFKWNDSHKWCAYRALSVCEWKPYASTREINNFIILIGRDCLPILCNTCLFIFYL